jgi:hypothetical protein
MDSDCLENTMKISGTDMKAEILQVVDDTFEWETDTGAPRVYSNTISRKPELPPATFSDDPVALSIMSYLIWLKNPHRRWVNLAEVGVPSDEARRMACELRTYYTHRNTMKTLMGQPITEFQHKMISFLMDTRSLTTDEQGILYRLPYFWQEDQALDRVFESATDLGSEFPGGLTVHMTATLTPIREVFKSRKSGDLVQFWFANSDGQRCLYDVRADNKLISVFRSLFRQPSLQVECDAQRQTLPGSHIRTRFWRLMNLEIAQ